MELVEVIKVWSVVWSVVTLQADSQVTTESEKIFPDQAIAQDCEDYEH